MKKINYQDFIGYKLRGEGKVIGLAGKTKTGVQLLKCQCKCGIIFDCLKSRIIGNTSHKPRYGCKKCCYKYIRNVLINKPDQGPSDRIKSMIGKRFGRLRVLSIYKKTKHSNYKYKCQCDCGNTSFPPYSSLISGQSLSCGCLRKESMPRGKKHHNWNPILTDKERNRNRDEIQLKKIRKWIFNRDNYTCRKCKAYGCRLNMHHCDSWHVCIEGRYAIDNLITLCYKCHRKFHSIYGGKYNTREQFQLFCPGFI